MGNKVTLISIIAMIIGAVLVISGLVQVPTVAKVLVILGVVSGFCGYKLYENRDKYDKIEDLFYG